MNFTEFLTEWTVIVEAKGDMEKLEANKKPLTDDEHTEVIKKRAVWNHGANGGETPAVWKSVDNDGKTTYITSTHRAFATAPTLKGAINKYHNSIKRTA